MAGGARTATIDMHVPASAAVPASPSTPAQRRRQDLILDRTLELLDEVGPDGLQLRDVVERSGIALATIYRYFPSKDYLIVEALARWASGLRGRMLATGSQPADAGERLADLLRLATRAFEQHPNYSRAVLSIIVSTDPLVEIAERNFRSTFTSALSLALVDLDPDVAADIEVVVCALLTDQWIAWSTGRSGTAGSESQLERGIRVLKLALGSQSPRKEEP